MRSYEISAARLPRRRTGSRYATEGVDRYLDEAAAALRCWEGGTAAALRADAIVHQEFASPPLFMPGYDADAVDDLLDRVVVQLREYEPRTQLEAERQKAVAAQETELRETLAHLQQEPDDRDGA